MCVYVCMYVYIYIYIYIYIIFSVCVGKSTSAHYANSALGSPLSNQCCRCAGIILQNGCQVANRVTGVRGENFIHGSISEVSRQRAGCTVSGVLW